MLTSHCFYKTLSNRLSYIIPIILPNFNVCDVLDPHHFGPKTKLGKEFNDMHFMGEGQRAKKVVSDSPGLVDFAIGLVNSLFNLPMGK